MLHTLRADAINHARIHWVGANAAAKRHNVVATKTANIFFAHEHF